MPSANGSRKSLRVLSPLLGLALVMGGVLRCNTKMVSHENKIIAFLLVGDKNVAVYEMGAAKFEELALKNTPQEMERLISQQAHFVEDVSKPQLRSPRLGRFSKVIVSGSLDDLTAKQLYVSGVPFIRSLDSYNPLLSKPQQMEIMFLGSKNQSTFRSMYGNQDISAITQVTEGGDNIGSIVESAAELNKKLIEAQKNEYMVTLVCHEKNGVIPFTDGDIGLAEIGQTLKVSRLTILSCNTYQTGDLGFRSTGTINLESVISGLKKTKMQHPGKVSGSDFFSSFVTNFKACERSQQVAFGIKVVSGATGVACVVVVGYKVGGVHKGIEKALDDMQQSSTNLLK
jgi:hypothetical protein